MTVTRLPDRPLRRKDIAALDGDDRLQVVPYGGIPDGQDVRIYTIKLAGGGTAYALGYDDAKEQWERLASAPAADLAAADNQLDAVLDDWVQNEYGSRFEVMKTV